MGTLFYQYHKLGSQAETRGCKLRRPHSRKNVHKAGAENVAVEDGCGGWGQDESNRKCLLQTCQVPGHLSVVEAY